ncbi:MAG: DUF4013 domain-containing protein [Anaerolineales bacterium]
MFFGFNLQEIFTFPLKDQEARKHFLIGCLVSLAAFVIPILPYLVLFGYAVRIAKQILNNESPRMVAWDDWGAMAKDGLKMIGIRMIFSLPILIFMIPLIIAGFAFPIIISTSSSSDIERLLPIFIVLIFSSICILIPISIPLALIIPAAEMSVIEKDDFSAGFRFREWWPIFRINLSGFIVAFGIYYLTAIVLSFAVQFLYITLIFACLLIVVLPATTMYIALIMYATTAQAYRDGKLKLSQAPLASTSG